MRSDRFSLKATLVSERGVAVIDETYHGITLRLRLAEMWSDKSFITFIRDCIDADLPNKFPFRPDGVHFSNFLIPGNRLFDVSDCAGLGRGGRRRH
jgi:hypothetical protein